MTRPEATAHGPPHADRRRRSEPRTPSPGRDLGFDAWASAGREYGDGPLVRLPGLLSRPATGAAHLSQRYGPRDRGRRAVPRSGSSPASGAPTDAGTGRPGGVGGFARLLPRPRLGSLFVQPATLLRWHRALVAKHWTYPHGRPDRPGIPKGTTSLVLRLATENPTWDCRRIHGEPAIVGITIAPSGVRAILKGHGIEPSPRRSGPTWTEFTTTPPEPGAAPTRGARPPSGRTPGSRTPPRWTSHGGGAG